MLSTIVNTKTTRMHLRSYRIRAGLSSDVTTCNWQAQCECDSTRL